MAYVRIGTFCPVCGEFIDGGLIAAFDGRPDGTALLEDFEMVEFVCGRCGTAVYTPDYESMCEIEEGDFETEEYDDGDNFKITILSNSSIDL